MKKLIFTILFLLPMSVALLARPAYPGKVRHTQPDGKVIEVTIHGDEWGHWTTDESGTVVSLDADGFYRVVPGATPEVAAKAATLRRQVMRQTMQQANASTIGGYVAVGQVHFLVILVEFADKAFKTENVQQAVTQLLNDPGYSQNGATGSARDFYYQSSNGYFEPIFDVYGPATLENNMSYYGGNDNSGNDKRAEYALKEGCQALDDDIDFAQYDVDNNGQVDMVFMIYAGYGEADGGGADTIWPHMYYLKDGCGINLVLDGKTINKYACANELAAQGSLKGKLDGIGAVCHEFGHAMGLPDFYDTDYSSNGQAGGMYDFSLMCGGSYNNASRTPPFFNMEERILLGWTPASSAYQTFTKTETVTIPAYRPDLGDPVAYKTPTDQDGEYFVYECRDDKNWDSGLPSHGLMVYHVDKSSRKITVYGYYNVTAKYLWTNWEQYNAINENGSHPCCYVIPAANQSSLNYNGSYSRILFPGTGSQKIKEYTPNSWNGVDGDVSFSEITYSGGNITLKATVAGAPEPPDDPEEVKLDYNCISNPGNGVYAAGSQFELKLITAENRVPQSVQWYFDGTATQEASVTLTSGTHLVEAVITLSSSKTDYLTLEITAQ